MVLDRRLQVVDCCRDGLRLFGKGLARIAAADAGATGAQARFDDRAKAAGEAAELLPFGVLLP